MKKRAAKDWIKALGKFTTPPGCFECYVSAPSHLLRGAMTVGIVPEHRFAFFFWAVAAREYWIACKEPFRDMPVLVTVDWHDDTGCVSDAQYQGAQWIDLRDRAQLSLFCWAGLSSLNDNQIAAALYLGLFSDVYVLMKAESGPQDRGKSYTVKDNHGRTHTVRYFDRPKDLISELEYEYREVYLDIDLDYFTKAGLHSGSAPIRRPSIRKFLAFNGDFVESVFARLVGLTIALEPECCGGLSHSLEALGILNEEFFGGTLMSEDCRWRDGS